MFMCRLERLLLLHETDDSSLLEKVDQKKKSFDFLLLIYLIFVPVFLPLFLFSLFAKLYKDLRRSFFPFFPPTEIETLSFN